MSANPFGLSRHIPLKVKRDVRRKSKNGCVICRSLIYQYEHFEPEFTEATEHNADGICLLCASCHQDATSGRVSKLMVSEAYQRVSEDADAKPPFYIPRLNGTHDLRLGSSTFRYLRQGTTLISYDGEALLSLTYVGDQIFGGFRPSFSGVINDANGEAIVTLDDNCITSCTDALDIKLEGSQLTFSRGPRKDDIALQLTFPGDGSIEVNRVRMAFGDLTVELDNVFGVTVPTLSNQRITWLFDAIFDAPSEIISYSTDTRGWKFGDMQIGRNGTHIPGTGCTIAKGCGSMILRKIQGFGQSPFDS